MTGLTAHLSHRYAAGAAIDSSGNARHGRPTEVDFVGDLAVFSQDGSRIDCPGLPALPDIVVVAAEVLITGDFQADRQNVLENHLSFAGFINGDLSASFSCHVGGEWHETRTEPSLLKPHTLIEIVAIIEAGRCCSLMVDGQRVAISPLPQGALRESGPLGFVVGMWPDGEQYGLRGAVRAVDVSSMPKSPTFRLPYDPQTDGLIGDPERYIRDNIDRNGAVLLRGQSNDRLRNLLDAMDPGRRIAVIEWFASLNSLTDGLIRSVVANVQPSNVSILDDLGRELRHFLNGRDARFPMPVDATDYPVQMSAETMSHLAGCPLTVTELSTMLEGAGLSQLASSGGSGLIEVLAAMTGAK